jgi:hypothetical protein
MITILGPFLSDALGEDIQKCFGENQWEAGVGFKAFEFTRDVIESMGLRSSMRIEDRKKCSESREITRITTSEIP